MWSRKSDAFSFPASLKREIPNLGKEAYIIIMKPRMWSRDLKERVCLMGWLKQVLACDTGK